MLRVTDRMHFATVLLTVILLSANHAAAQEQGSAGPVMQTVEFAKVGDISLEMDIYKPAVDTLDPLPVCMYIHGGGWQGGDKAEGEIFLRGPLASGWIGVSVNYRLSSQATWPAQIDDIHAALEWIRQHSRELQADTERIVVAGGSAGGHLSLMAGLDQRSWKGYRIIGAFSLYGPTDLLADEWDFHQIRYMIVNLLGEDPRSNVLKSRSASPEYFVDSADVPVLLVHGTQDVLVPYSQSTAMLDVLQSAGVDSRLLTVPGGNHGNFDETTPDWSEIARQFQEWSNRLAGLEKLDTVELHSESAL